MWSNCSRLSPPRPTSPNAGTDRYSVQVRGAVLFTQVIAQGLQVMGSHGFRGAGITVSNDFCRQASGPFTRASHGLSHGESPQPMHGSSPAMCFKPLIFLA